MKNGDKPAFIETNTTVNNDHMATGLTKREYFAAMAMQGLLSIYDAANNMVPNVTNIEYCAKISVTAADELLKQLEA